VIEADAQSALADQLAQGLGQRILSESDYGWPTQSESEFDLVARIYAAMEAARERSGDRAS
jgi:hypothetical protein